MRFRDGTRTYEMGDVVTVPDQDGIRFAAYGWAGEVPEQSSVKTETDLQVHNSRLGVTNKGI
jgi:hypothetical protein